MSKNLNLLVSSEPQFIVVRRTMAETGVTVPTRSFDMQAASKMLLKDEDGPKHLNSLKTYGGAEGSGMQQEDLGSMLENLHFRFNETSISTGDEPRRSPSPAVKMRHGRKSTGSDPGHSEQKNQSRRHTPGKTSKGSKPGIENGAGDQIFEAFGLHDPPDASTTKHPMDDLIFTPHPQVDHKKSKEKQAKHLTTKHGSGQLKADPNEHKNKNLKRMEKH